MRISRMSYLGVEFLARLAERSASTPCTAQDLARWIGRSDSYAETILAGLRTAGLVKPLRGPGGGYRLARAAESITVAEILRGLDDRVAVPPPPGSAAPPDRVTLLWNSVERYSLHYLERITLADVSAGRACGTHGAAHASAPSGCAEAPQS